MAAKKAGRPKKARLAAAIAETRKDPLRGHNALIKALNDGKFEQRRGAIDVWTCWRTAYIKAYVEDGGTREDAIRDSYGMEQRHGPKDRLARLKAARSVADEYRIGVRRVQQILAAVLRGDRLLKSYHRDLFEAQYLFNEPLALAYEAEKIMRKRFYADLRGSKNALAAAFIRAHERLFEEDETYTERAPPAKRK